MASDAGAKRDPLIGQTIGGRFRVIRKLGEGGMGVVYLADQISFHRKVALKVLHGFYTRDEEFTERCRREARLAAMLNHAHTVTVYDFDQGEDGSLFIAMEYVEGRNLRDTIQEGEIGLHEAVRFARQIAEGLDAAHRAGVIHRDIKPENVMVSSANNEVKLMDFGIASVKDAEGMSRITRTGMIVGTPAYMAPERIEKGQTDEKTDIYSFGILLYEMLTGDVPFSAPTPAAILIKHLQEIPRSLRTIRAEIPTSLERVVMQALEKEPQKRQVNIGKIAQTLRKIESSLEIEFTISRTFVGEPAFLRKTEEAGTGQYPSGVHLQRKGFGISGTAVAIVVTLVLGTGTAAWIITAPHHVQKLLAEGLALVGLEKGNVESTPSTKTETGQKPAAPRGPTSATSVQNSGEAGEGKPPEEPVVKEHLVVGGFYLDRGQYSEAIAEFEQALSLDPRNQEVRERLERAKRAWNAERKLGLAR